MCSASSVKRSRAGASGAAAGADAFGGLVAGRAGLAGGLDAAAAVGGGGEVGEAGVGEVGGAGEAAGRRSLAELVLRLFAICSTSFLGR